MNINPYAWTADGFREDPVSSAGEHMLGTGLCFSITGLSHLQKQAHSCIFGLFGSLSHAQKLH
jgi:hypothetical protein